MTTATHEQTAAVKALVEILAAFPHLPAAELGVRLVCTPGHAAPGLRINLYDAPAAFERWREALNVDPARLNLVALPSCHVIRGHGEFAGVPLQLLGYLTLLDPTAAPAA